MFSPEAKLAFVNTIVNNNCSKQIPVAVTYISRFVYREVTSGGSFGANPLLQHIGFIKATAIAAVEIKWPVSNAVQVFKNIQPGDYVMIKEGDNSVAKKTLVKVDFTLVKQGVINCPPPVKN